MAALATITKQMKRTGLGEYTPRGRLQIKYNTTHTVTTSHGELTVDGSGYILGRKLEDTDAGRRIESITRFDLTDWRRFWGDPMPQRFDIRDLGYWYVVPATNETVFEYADENRRSEAANNLLERRAPGCFQRP